MRRALSMRQGLLLEVLALPHQLAVRARSNRRFRPSDRLLWLILRRLWPRWRDVLVLVLVLVQPATVDGTALGVFDAGGAGGDVLADHASIRRLAN